MLLKFTAGEKKALLSLQKKIGELRKKRGFTQDPERAMILLMEEVGEVAQQMKRLWSPNYDIYTKDALAEELADVQFVLLGLSDLLGIKLADALDKKTKQDAERKWKSIDNPIPLKELHETKSID